jgi:predicted nucleotidyltransferase
MSSNNFSSRFYEINCKGLSFEQRFRFWYALDYVSLHVYHSSNEFKSFVFQAESLSYATDFSNWLGNLKKIEIEQILEKLNNCSIYKKHVRNIERFKYSKQIKNMIEDLLDTKLKLRIAKLFASTNAELQVSDVARILKISKSRASECLKELAEKRLLECKKIGKSLIYRKASSQFARKVFESLLLEKSLEESLEKDLVEKLGKLNPSSIVIFGSSAQKLKLNGDVDVLVLVKDSFEKDEIYKISSELSENYGISISILALKEDEFKEKVRKGDAFAINVLATHKKIWGKDLEEIAWQ